MPALKLIFMGTAELACPSLSALRASDHFQVLAVVTQPDRPKGRHLELTPSPVKALAQQLGLPVLQPQQARDPSFVAQVQQMAPELIVVVAYGQILPPALLEIPRWGCLNVHASLLPKYRGAAPIQWALLNDETQTGVTIMKMDAGLDTGPILAQETVAIEPTDTAQTLHDRLATVGAALLVRTIPQYVSGQIAPRPQPAQEASYARKITKEDGLVDWTQPARAIWNRVRALVPWPGAFTYLSTAAHAASSGSGLPEAGPAAPALLRLIIWEAEPVEGLSGAPGEVLQADKTGLVVACGTGALRIRTLQREGGRRLPVAEFLLGHPIRVGQRLGRPTPPANQPHT
jgi:methionyl-tRNA formyltransferase